MGRHSDYSEETTTIICDRIASGEALIGICRDKDMPDKATVFRWLAKHEAFRDKYARARELQMEAMAVEILEIADDSEGDRTKEGAFVSEHVQRSRLRVDTRKWLMSKLAPKKYGDKLDLNHSGSVKRDLDSLTDEELARIATGGSKATTGEAEGQE